MFRPLALTLLIASAAAPALAHPHVFIDATARFVFDRTGQLSGLQIAWRYDAFSTLVLYDQLELDKDGDGKLDAQDLERVAVGETDWPPEYEGDTYLWIGGAKVPLARPVNGIAQMIGDRVEVTFDLPLAKPQPAAGLRASLKIYDPGYYYAYTVTGAVADACEASVLPFQSDKADAALLEELSALSLEDMPSNPQIGARFADEIILQCD